MKIEKKSVDQNFIFFSDNIYLNTNKRRNIMAEIKLSELRPAGSELLQDSENFLNELNDREIENVVGGNTIASAVSQVSASVGSILSLTDVGISQTNVTF